MADVVMRLLSGNSWSQRQYGSRSIQSLNLTLLISAENHRFIGWIQIHADDIAQLLDECRVLAELEILGSVRLQTVRLPEASYRRRTDMVKARHRPRAPMRSVTRRGVQCVCQNRLHLLDLDLLATTRPGGILEQTGNPDLRVPVSP